MKVEHIRKLLPVGHGAFFVERLIVDGHRVFTAVYDCGDSKGGNLVKKYAQQEFGKPEKPSEYIDLLFISHFDSDHVNGLEFIKPYLKHTTRLFIPFYYSNLLNIYNTKKRFGIELVVNISKQVGIQPILVQYDYDKVSEQIINIDEDNFENNGNVVRSGQSIVKKYNGQPIWKYVPFNLFNEEKLFTDFKHKVKSVLKWNNAKFQDYGNWSEQDIKSLRNIYRTFSRYTINDNSLIVLSDRYSYKYIDIYDGYVEEISAELLHNFNNCPYHHRCCRHFRSSCLYTGDTVMKRSVRRSKYIDRYESFIRDLSYHTHFVSLMQIPHHGSSINSNASVLCDNISHRLFCNYAQHDTHNGTFFLTANTLDSLWKNVYGVTEDDSTVFEEHYTFYV